MRKILRILNFFVAAVLCLPSVVLVAQAYLYLERTYDFSRYRESMLLAFGHVGAVCFAVMALWVAALSLRRSPKKYEPLTKEEVVRDFFPDLPGGVGAVPADEVETEVPRMAEPVSRIPVFEVDDFLEPEGGTSPEMRIPFDPTHECTIPQPPGWYSCTRGFHLGGPCNPSPIPSDEFVDDVKTAVETTKARRLTLSFLPIRDPKEHP